MVQLDMGESEVWMTNCQAHNYLQNSMLNTSISLIPSKKISREAH
jgi:hypothetical protein